MKNWKYQIGRGGIIQFTNYYHKNHWLTILKIMIHKPKMLPFWLSVKLGLLNHGKKKPNSTRVKKWRRKHLDQRRL